jgi:segregation and condensation protein A
MMKTMDLEVAGEFVLMAATLIRIKAQMLLPKTEGEEEEEDPRAQLVSALLEYKRYKELSGMLKEKESQESKFSPRTDFSYLEIEEDRMDETEVSLGDLLAAFKRVCQSVSKVTFHQVKIEDVNLDQRMDHVLNYLKDREKVKFAELFLDNPIRLVMVVTFIAILELIRLRKIKVIQKKNFSQIWVHRNS